MQDAPGSRSASQQIAQKREDVPASRLAPRRAFVGWQSGGDRSLGVPSDRLRLRNIPTHTTISVARQFQQQPYGPLCAAKSAAWVADGLSAPDAARAGG